LTFNTLTIGLSLDSRGTQTAETIMAQIKTMTRIADKWQRVTSGAGQEYAEGVSNPTKDWKAETLASEKAYEAGLQKSIQNKSFGKGVSAAGSDKWQKNAIDKGTTRFAQGVSLSGDAYSKGFEPYRAVIQGTTLPPRGAKGDPANIQRVAVLATALHAKKVSGGK
jgi:hypothetical protein